MQLKSVNYSHKKEINKDSKTFSLFYLSIMLIKANENFIKFQHYKTDPEKENNKTGNSQNSSKMFF